MSCENPTGDSDVDTPEEKKPVSTPIGDKADERKRNQDGPLQSRKPNNQARREPPPPFDVRRKREF